MKISYVYINLEKKNLKKTVYFRENGENYFTDISYVGINLEKNNLRLLRAHLQLLKKEKYDSR